MPSDDSRRINCIEDLTDSIRNVFKKYTRANRKRAWDLLVSKKGRKEIDLLLIDPNRSLNRIRALSEQNVQQKNIDFLSWIERKDA